MNSKLRQPDTSGDITRLLHAWQLGDRAALEEIIEYLYSDLRRLAQSYLNREREAATLQATALVHEAFLRLERQHGIDWQGRRHFFAMAATLMRRILIDAARRRAMMRRRGLVDATALDSLHFDHSQNDHSQDDHSQDDQVLAVAHALERLRQHDAELAMVVELRFFLGLEHAETAAVLGVTSRTIKRRWQAARLWLFDALQPPKPRS